MTGVKEGNHENIGISGNQYNDEDIGFKMNTVVKKSQRLVNRGGEYNNGFKEGDDEDIVDMVNGGDTTDRGAVNSGPSSPKFKDQKKKFTKVDDILRSSQENAMSLSKADLDKMFGMQETEMDKAILDDDKNLDQSPRIYMQKFVALRE